MNGVQPATRPDRRVLTGAGWRAALVVVAAVAVAVELPAWARLPLSAAAVLGVGTFFLRRSGGRGLLDLVLVVTGGGVVALTLLGLLLNVLPTGIGPLGWALAVGVLELVVLALLAVFRQPVPRVHIEGDPARRNTFKTHLPVAGIAWGAAAAAVLAGAVVYSTVSFDATHVSPLAIAAEPNGSSVTVTVSAGSEQGPYELDLVSADGRTVIARSIRVGSGNEFTERIPMPATRAVLQLVHAGSTTPVRQLILDRTAKATSR
jgi:hypothetical protein